MALSPGSRLGPYEIVSPLGAGGMGEVYRATDVRLGRQVAVKVLPDRFAEDPEALTRFEREARAVAALSHPGICTLHDVGREGQVPYLVMELLDGETLAERLLKGALPFALVCELGAQIGSALAAAHERGIAHRDLKPGNVMVTRSGVKLLDFGLAKALETAEAGAGGPAPTASVLLNVTQEGVLLGTLPYMSPEQLEGRRADARSDIFAFGAVLYEMATGQRAFSGRSQASLISAILTSEPPPITTQRPLSPAGLDRLVRTCLAKDPDERWQSVRDVVLQLRTLGEAQPAPEVGVAAPRSSWLPWGLAGLAVPLVLWSWLRPAPSVVPPHTVRLTVAPPAGGAFTSWAEANALAVSPDGATLALSASDRHGPPRLWLRSLGSTELRPLPGSEGAASPFWSPDGRSLGFSAGAKLKRIDLAGDLPVTLCDLPPGGGGAATWGRDSILFAVSPAESNGLYRVPSAGGKPILELAADRSKGERRLAWPTFLPDGEHYLYALRREDFSWHLMSASPGTAPKELAPIGSATFLVGPQHLAFVREGTLLSQRFDWRSGKLSGEPLAISDTVRYFLSTASSAFAASAAGTIAFQTGDNVNRLTWFDRGGRALGNIGQPGNHLNLSLTSDGQRALYDRTRPGTGTYDIWSWDLAMQTESRLTSDPETEVRPLQVRAGAIVYSANLLGQAPQLVRRDLATGRDEELLPAGGFRLAQDVSPDGSTLVYSERGSDGTSRLWVVALQGSRSPRALLETPFNQTGARLSPDGRAVAFVSNDSGRPEAYVMPYPEPGERRRISVNGVRGVRWNSSGREIFLLGADNRLWSVPVRTQPKIQTQPPALLFELPGGPWADFDVALGGERFLAIVQEVDGNELPATVIVNWSAEPER